MASLDRVFELLSRERRRYALYYLERQNGPVSVDELAERVADWESDPSSASVPDRKYEQVEVDLHHNDLPKAAEAEYIEYDSEAGEVEITGTPPEVNAILSVAETIERPDRNP